MRKLLKHPDKVRLNLGCGKFHIKGLIGIDLEDCGQEVIWDLRQGIPFPDGSAIEIYSCHFLEHLDDDSSMEIFKEIYRVLAKGCKTSHQLPYATDPTAFFCGHKTFWNEAKINALIKVPGLEGFKILKNEKRGAELHFELQK